MTAMVAMVRIAVVMTRKKVGNPKASVYLPMPLGETSGRLGGLHASGRVPTRWMTGQGSTRERGGSRMLRRRAYPA